ncbi:MAG TPA: four helix bundle protein [Verrucomicrobiae bacterium]|nr:four helix bundle protein [Verrucomicrobiae bacterium]
MRSSKLKAQSSKKAPYSNGEAPNGRALDWWWLKAETDAVMVLREEATASSNGRPWDLIERTALFGEQIVAFSKKITHNPTNNRLIGQLVGAGTSVGANYCEANEAVSKKDFKNTISRCMKEAKETKFFLRMIVASEPQLADEARPLYREAHELLCIFGAMRHK